MLATLLSACLYLVFIRRKYAHLPSPVMSSFFQGHYLDALRISKEQTGSDTGPPSRAFLQWSREVGNLYVVFFAWLPIVVTLNPQDVKVLMTSPACPKPIYIFKQFRRLLGERLLGNSLFSIREYTEWRPRRKLYDQAFNKTYLQCLAPQFNACVNKLVDELKLLADGKTLVSFKKYMHQVTMDVISQVAFATDFKEEWKKRALDLKYTKGNGLHFLIQHTFKGFHKVLFNPIFQYLHPFEAESYRETTRVLRAMGRDCILKTMKAVRSSDRIAPNILTCILQMAETEHNADTETLVDDFVLFYIAGQETSAVAALFALVLVHQHADVLEKLLQEIDHVLGKKDTISFEDLDKLCYTEQVIKESMRMYPPFTVSRRLVQEGGLVLSGYQIPAGTEVNMSGDAMCHMQEYVDNPDIFDPSRFDSKETILSSFVYLPFGAGHRSCIGKLFAMIEMKIILARLLQVFAITLPQNYKLEIQLGMTQQPRDDVECTILCR
ncbi:hypothetical protein EMCRGX_G013400 [Ephydatia muelleri]